MEVESKAENQINKIRSRKFKNEAMRDPEVNQSRAGMRDYLITRKRSSHKCAVMIKKMKNMR